MLTPVCKVGSIWASHDNRTTSHVNRHNRNIIHLSFLKWPCLVLPTCFVAPQNLQMHDVLYASFENQRFDIAQRLCNCTICHLSSCSRGITNAWHTDAMAGPAHGSTLGYQNRAQNRWTKSGVPTVRAKPLLEVVIKNAGEQACGTSPLLKRMGISV